MYKIEKKTSGYLLTFSGMFELPEMQQWYDNSKAILADSPASFGVIVDLRTMVPLSTEVQKVLIEGQQLYRKKGMQRSAVIISGAIATNQFKWMAEQSGIYEYERYIDSEVTENWVRLATDWVINGNDPDKLKAAKPR
jgi:hypothetical protein